MLTMYCTIVDLLLLVLQCLAELMRVTWLDNPEWIILNLRMILSQIQDLLGLLEMIISCCEACGDPWDRTALIPIVVIGSESQPPSGVVLGIWMVTMKINHQYYRIGASIPCDESLLREFWLWWSGLGTLIQGNSSDWAWSLNNGGRELWGRRRRTEERERGKTTR